MSSKKLQVFLCTALTFVIILTVFAGCWGARNVKISKSDFVLNTVATITIYGMTNEDIIDECFEICRNYESLLSRTIESSEVSMLNNRKISIVSEETAELISEGLYYSEVTDGNFDITIEPLTSLWNFSSDSPQVPNQKEIDDAKAIIDYKSIDIEDNTIIFKNESVRIDLGAIAKGYIADRVKDYLVSQGVENAIINLGGNVVCIGGKTNNQGFKIGILRPFSEDAIASVDITDLSVVTSGTYERYFIENNKTYHHILNPKTGYPYDNGLLSVTIIGNNSSTCDALSTACFALGLENGIKLINGIADYYAIFITDDYAIHISDGLKDAVKIQLLN